VYSFGYYKKRLASIFNKKIDTSKMCHYGVNVFDELIKMDKYKNSVIHELIEKRNGDLHEINYILINTTTFEFIRLYINDDGYGNLDLHEFLAKIEND